MLLLELPVGCFPPGHPGSGPSAGPPPLQASSHEVRAQEPGGLWVAWPLSPPGLGQAGMLGAAVSWAWMELSEGSCSCSKEGDLLEVRLYSGHS